MVLNALRGILSDGLAIDLGTSNTLIYEKNKGIILNEPSVVAVKRADGGVNKILAVGREAKMMLGRTPENIEAIRPMRDGVIANFEITEFMLRYFIQQAHRRRKIFRPRIMISVPSGVTPVEKRAVRECASAGASEVFLIEEPMAAAIGAGLPITEPRSSMVVNLGGGTIEVTVISLSGIVYSKSVRVGGDKMDQSIMQHINRKYNFLIGPGTAEAIKMKIGSACPAAPEEMEIRGRDLTTGTPRTLIINSNEVTEMISEEVNTIVQTVRSALEQMPPELSADILEQGIMLTGGGALLKNMDILLNRDAKVPVTVTAKPLEAVAIGAGIALENKAIRKQVAIE
ncbi:MAG: rod shape-determining protein [Desulfobacteraceae bacterium]|nr:MAG: rod shape-determining protein [Desulfobacteraceae bacterium]